MTDTTDAANPGDPAGRARTGTTAPRPPVGDPEPATVPAAGPRPLIERVGMAAIALVLAVLFGIVAAASFVGGEPFLGAMGAAGCLMVTWAGGRTLLRG